MQLRYKDAGGNEKVVHLTESPVIVGRIPECGICVRDDKVSRRHYEIRFWDGAYVVKDLSSQNGTFVNEHRIEIAVLKPGDAIRSGGTTVIFEEKKPIGGETAIRQVEGKMQEGKGYRTILREIVHDIERNSGESGKPADRR